MPSNVHGACIVLSLPHIPQDRLDEAEDVMPSWFPELDDDNRNEPLQPGGESTHFYDDGNGNDGDDDDDNDDNDDDDDDAIITLSAPLAPSLPPSFPYITPLFLLLGR